AADGIRDKLVTGVQTCALPICRSGERDRGDARGVSGARGGRQEGVEAAADARLHELGCRGVRPRRLDRVGRGARAGARREGRARSEERRVGKEWRTGWSRELEE